MTRVGLYGQNGHQIQGKLVNHFGAHLIAAARHDLATLPDELRRGVTMYASLDELLADSRVQLVSLCSPRRADQARDAIRAMRAGKHVYAEKTCATSEADLDAIIAASRETGQQFHEMADTVFQQPYFAMRRIVAAGTIGTIVQAFAQKSYPLALEMRPQDEDIDAGLTRQAGVHALRMIEHVSGVRIAEIHCVETKLGNERGGNLRVASSMMMRLANGGVASAVANYLNPRGFGTWGNEALRLFGTLGMIESTDGGTRTRLVVGDVDRGPIDVSFSPPDFFDSFLAKISGTGTMPFKDLEEELHPTRMAIRAKADADRRGPAGSPSGSPVEAQKIHSD
jgi:predicted dehydrogenase